MPDSTGLIRTVAIFGPGLIGGSFALALRQAGFAGEILGVGASPYVERALNLGVVSQIASLEQAAGSADVMYLSETVDGILSLVEKISSSIRVDCLVTDSGSTKRTIVELATALLPHGCFLGGHPMAGKEKRGVENAEATLFQGRPYILTSQPQTPLAQEFVGWLQLIGANVVYLNADEHDRAVAFSSHLPQLLSTALALTLSRETGLAVESVAGPGLQQMTRLARSTPELWSSILASNHDEVGSAIEALTKTLNELRTNLSVANILDLLSEAGEYSYLLEKRQSIVPRI